MLLGAATGIFIGLIYIVRDYLLARKSLKSFRTTLARFRAIEWISGIGRERQKRLMHLPAEGQKEKP